MQVMKYVDLPFFPKCSMCPSGVNWGEVGGGGGVIPRIFNLLFKGTYTCTN